MKNLKCILVFGFLFVQISCNNDEAVPALTQAPDNEMVQANTIAEISQEIDFNLAINVASENGAYSSKNGAATTQAACPTVTVNNTTPGVFPKIITVDFGTACASNGLIRSGVLTITLSNYVLTTGAVLTIQRNNYFINARKIEGTVTYTNITSTPGTPKWTRVINNGQVTLPNGAVFTHTGTRTVQQIQGFATLTFDDNVYEILSGTHTVNRPNGTTLTGIIVTPLIKKYSCNYISQGSINLNGTVLNGVLDYGNNTCDNQATYTHSNGQVYNIVL